MFERFKTKKYINELTYAIEKAFEARGKDFDDNHTIDWNYDEEEIYVTVDKTDHTFTYFTPDYKNVPKEELVEKVLSDIDEYEKDLETQLENDEYEDESEYDEDDYEDDYDEEEELDY